MSIREEIRELCIAHDRFMAEQASEPIGAAYMQRQEDSSGLVYKTTETPMSAAPEPDAEASDGDWQDTVAEAMGICLAETRKEIRAEFKAALTERDTTIARLEGKIEALLAVFGKGEVVDLPRGFWRRDRDVA